MGKKEDDAARAEMKEKDVIARAKQQDNHDFASKVFLHTMNRLHTFIPIVEMKSTIFNAKGNSILDAALHINNESWDLKIILTKKT